MPIGSPNILKRIRFVVPTVMGTRSGSYEMRTGSREVALPGSPRYANAASDVHPIVMDSAKSLVNPLSLLPTPRLV